MTEVTCGTEVKDSAEVIEGSPLYQQWLSHFGREWTVERVHVTAALNWKKNVRMLCAYVTAIDPLGRRRTSMTFLRGSTVTIVPIIIGPDGKEYTVLVEQPRIPAGQMCISTPAGMVDNGDITFTALAEMAEEVGGDITWSQPQWLNRFATGSDAPMLVSAGGSDEDVQFCVVRTILSEEMITTLHGREAGAEEEDENTLVHVVVLLTEALPYLAQGDRRPSLKTVMAFLLLQQARQFRLSN
jgi:8-oxo-dGTP pyrophosphatase MutT (NUDIX family)